MFMFSSLNTTKNIHFHHITSAELELKTKKFCALLIITNTPAGKELEFCVPNFFHFCALLNIYACASIFHRPFDVLLSLYVGGLFPAIV